MAKPVSGGAPQSFFQTETPVDFFYNKTRAVINSHYFPYASAAIGTYFLADAIIDGLKSKQQLSKDEPLIHFVPKAAISALAISGGYYLAVDTSWVTQLCGYAALVRTVQLIGDNLNLADDNANLKNELEVSRQKSASFIDEILTGVFDSVGGSTPTPDSDTPTSDGDTPKPDDEEPMGS